MNAHFQVFKGAPRWRDPLFWMVVATYSALLAWHLYRGRGVWEFLFWTPVYLTLMMPHRLFLGRNWLISLSSVWMLWRFQRFEQIESYSYREDPDQPDENQDVSVTITLARTKGPRRRFVHVSIQKGARLAAFSAAMEARGVPSLEPGVRIADMTTLDEVFSPPFASIEAERAALYRLLNRPLPEN